jgi:tetratricopeptide (TPR) repeat protein
LPDKILTGASGGFIVSGGISWKPREPSVLEYIEKSEEKMIFVENAHELKEREIETIFVASRRNERLRFVLEVATPYKPEDKLGVDSYEVVELKGLSDKDIGEIVRRECPNFSDTIVRRIVSLTKGYPYIARSLAYICDRKNTEEEIFEFLETLRDDNMKHNLDKIHKEISNTLNEDSQVVVRRLAIAPPILTLKLIEAFCKGIPDNLDTALSDLFDRGILVKEEDGKGFYRIYHPLFREYLKSEKIQPTASEHWKQYYRKAMEDVKAEFDSIYILLEVLNEPDLFEELVKITENFVVINSTARQAHTWGDLEQAIFTWNALLEKAEEKKDKEWKAAAIGNIGVVYLTKGELDKALEYYEKALKLHEELGIKEGMANQLGNIGNIYQTKGELDKALGYYEDALKLNEELGKKEGMASQLGNIGIVYRIKGELGNALEYHEKALKLHEELGIKEGVAKDIGNIGIVYLTKGELNKALEYYEKALEIFEDMGSRVEIARTLMNIGDVFVLKGDKERALDHYQKAESLAVGSSVFESIHKKLKRLKEEQNAKDAQQSAKRI